MLCSGNIYCMVLHVGCFKWTFRSSKLCIWNGVGTCYLSQPLNPVLKYELLCIVRLGNLSFIFNVYIQFVFHQGQWLLYLETWPNLHGKIFAWFKSDLNAISSHSPKHIAVILCISPNILLLLFAKLMNSC